MIKRTYVKIFCCFLILTVSGLTNAKPFDRKSCLSEIITYQESEAAEKTRDWLQALKAACNYQQPKSQNALRLSVDYKYISSSLSNLDILPPEIIDITMSASKVDVTNGPQTVEVTVQAKDETGIDRTTFWFRQLDYGLYVFPDEQTGWEYNAESDSYINVLTFIFSSDRVNGRYGFSNGLSMEDVLGNRTNDYNSAEKLNSLGFEPYLNVTNANEVDTSAPEIIAITMSASKVDVTNGPQTVEVTVQAKDETGIDRTTFWFRQLDYGLYIYPEERTGWKYNADSDSYINVLTFIFSSDRVNGRYGFSNGLSMEDILGNRTTDYNSALNLAYSGFNPYLSVVNGSGYTEFDSSLTLTSQVLVANKLSYEIEVNMQNNEEYELFALVSSGEMTELPTFSSTSSMSTSCLYQSTSGQTTCSIFASGDVQMNFLVEVEDESSFKTVVSLTPKTEIVDPDYANNFILLNLEGVEPSDPFADDQDEDGILDDDDNCPAISNENQLDTDGDDIGNACDPDDDNDGLSDEYELQNGLDPLNPADALLDSDNDGLTNLEEFLLGSNPNQADSDGDGVLDGEEKIHQSMMRADDYNDDGIDDIAELYLQGARPFVLLLNAVDLSSIRTLSWDLDYRADSIKVASLNDFNSDGVDDIYLFGIRTDVGNEGRPQVVVVDPLTGNQIRAYNWPASLVDVTPLMLDDITGDGVADMGIQGKNKNNGRPQLIVRDGARGSAVATFSYPDLFTNGRYLQLSDMTGDGVDDIGLAGNKRGNGKLQVRVVDATDSSNRLRSYNFGTKWDNTEFIQLSDTDGNGTNDWGMFGIRKEDGRPQLLNKRGDDARGILRIHSWPGDMQDAAFWRMRDMTADGTDDVAVVGLRGNNRYQFNIKDGIDRAASVANLGWPNNWSDVSFVVLPDISNDDIVDVGLFGRSASGTWEFVVKDGSTKLEIRRYDFGTNWGEKPTIMPMGDMNEDGVPDFLLYGNDASGDMQMLQYSGASAGVSF